MKIVMTALAAILLSSGAQVMAATPNASEQMASATKPFNCLDLRKASQKLSVHAANITNRDVTKTAEGGPYKRVDLICKEMYCESVAKEDFKLVLDRTHPDANESGYVRLPRVDVPSEFAALQSAAAEVRLLAGAQGQIVMDLTPEGERKLAGALITVDAKSNAFWQVLEQVRVAA
ncbi:MAG: hypothetical protein V4692_15155, partial [Bdellovibrionota bacterium]